MKKTATKRALDRMSFGLSLLIAVFFVPGLASASTISLQPLNETQFITTGSSDYGTSVSDIGNIATGTVIGGVQLQFSNINQSGAPLVRLLEYPDEATFRTNPYGGYIRSAQSTATITTDGSGFVNFTLPLTTNGFPYYYAIYYGGTNTFSSILGTSLSTGHTTFYGGASYPDATTTNAFYFQVYSGSGATQFFTPSPNFAGFATSTLARTCDSSFATTTGFLDTVGASISNGLCRVGSFLFVPSPDAITQFQNLASTTSSKIPFSYFYDVQAIYSGSSASTTQNFTSFSAGLSAIDFSSSTPMGSILPTNLTFLSSTTINHFMPVGMHDTLYNIMIFAIWFEVMYLIYHRVVPNKAKI